MNLTTNISKTEKLFLESNLPPPFVGKLVRLVLTTIKNESVANIPDLVAIFDTGLIESDYFDYSTGITHLVEELTPQPYIDSHYQLLGQTNEGLYYEFELNDPKNVIKRPKIMGLYSNTEDDEDFENGKRPKELIPMVKRSDLSKSLLSLRSAGIKLEEQRDLPNEPNHSILESSIESLKCLGLISNDSTRNLTHLGEIASKFALSVSPVFCAAIASSFSGNREEQVFAFLCSLIIESIDCLIENPSSSLLNRNFCNESDLVTIINTFFCVVSNDDETEKSGFVISTLYCIYSTISSIFNDDDETEEEKEKKSKILIKNSITHIKNQAGGILGAVDKFVLSLNAEKFLNIREASFNCVVGAGPHYQPTLIFQLDSALLSFSNSFLEERTDVKESSNNKLTTISFTKRPGWNGIQSPGNIYVLSMQTNDTSKLHTGFLLTRNPNKNTNLGVVSKKVDNPSLNSFFFVSLFEAYWNHQPTINDFIGIYHTREPNKDNAFLIHVTENDNSIYLNYCPKNNSVDNLMNEAIPILSSLMPFVPRSILIKNDIPLCSVEIRGYGTNDYTTSIHKFSDPEYECPITYSLNRETIKYAYDNRNILPKTMPSIRFAITGESISYKFINGRQAETDFEYPDTRPSLMTVFGNNFASHLILLVEKSYQNKPNPSTIVKPLAWIETKEEEERRKVTDEDDFIDENYIIEVASKIMNGAGYVKRKADLFYICLDNGHPTVNDGEIPAEIVKYVEYCEKEERSIKGGIPQLVKQMLKVCTKNSKIETAIPLKKLGSTSHCKQFANNESKEEIITKITDKLVDEIFKNCKIKKEDVQILFIGESLICIRVENLEDETLVLHPRAKDLWDETYQMCKADDLIKNNLINTLSLPITSIVHMPSIILCVKHFSRYQMNEINFVNKIKTVSEEIGFMLTAISEYLLEPEPRVLGEINLEVIGSLTSICLATKIIESFPTSQSENDGMMTMTPTCLQTTVKSRMMLDPSLGAAPTLTRFTDKVYQIPESEINSMKELMALRARDHTDIKRWKFDDRYQVLIIPHKDEAAAKELLKKVSHFGFDLICFFICSSDPPTILPQSLYIYEKNGKVESKGICLECIKSYFADNEDLLSVIDPVTKMMDKEKIKYIEKILPGIPTVDSDNDGDEIWPQVPLGQTVWTLMSDEESLGIYLKAYFTVITEFSIRKAANFFTFCPNHSDIVLSIPKAGVNLRCPYCDHFMCADCRTWHRMADPCIRLDPSFKRCPRCRVPTHTPNYYLGIKCRCGCHWCPKCTTDPPPAFNTAYECNNHMHEVHRDIWY